MPLSASRPDPDLVERFAEKMWAIYSASRKTNSNPTWAELVVLVDTDGSPAIRHWIEDREMIRAMARMAAKLFKETKDG